MTLPEFARLYLQSRHVSDHYAERLLHRAAALELRSGKSALADVLTERTVNAFLRHLDVSPPTLTSYRSDLLAVWRAAADLDLLPYPVARRIFRVPLPSLLVECYLLIEVRAILDGVKAIKGCYPNGVAKRVYWPAAIRLAWDSGIRRGDVWSFRRSAVRPDGFVRILQSKTKRVVPAMLRPSTIAALDAVGHDQPCRWTLDPSFFGRHFKAIAKAAGVSRGTFKWLRRASGSYVELAQPGAGGKHLGHASGATFEKHYDAKLGEHDLPMPPEL